MHVTGVTSPAPTLDDQQGSLGSDLRLVGQSARFKHILEQCHRVGPHDVTVLLVGETGTGKELLARAIHRLSPRSAGPFVPVDCASIPASLFADELFGHVRGAFTDAREAVPGLLLSSAGGVLFLDEVESLGLTAQGTLLRVLDSREWRPLGSREWRSLDARIIAATNEDLAGLVDRGLFRKDLYFRLASEVCYLPPLRERKDDIPLLARYFIVALGKKFRKSVEISQDAFALLQQHSWPGNVRELQHCLERAVLHASDGTLRNADLPVILSPCIEPKDSGYLNGGLSWKDARRKALDSWEKRFLSELMRQHAGNVRSVVHRLSLSRMQLYRLLRKHNLTPSH